METAIIKKLRFDPEKESAIINSPENFLESFNQIAGANKIRTELHTNMDWILVFVTNKKDVDTLAPEAIKSTHPDTIIWFAYPKKSSAVETDITRDKGWDPVHNRGWAGVSMISIDETWSAFRIKPQKTKPVKPTSDASARNRQ